MGAVQALGRLTQLQQLVMDDVFFNSNASLQSLSGLSDLRSCVLSGINDVPAEVDIGALSVLSRLTELQLDFKGVSTFDNGVLSRLCAGLPSLSALALPRDYDLSDVGVESLCVLTSLTHLGVGGGLDLTDWPSPHTLPRLPSLQKLRVWSTRMPHQLLRAMRLLPRVARLLGWGNTHRVMDDMNLEGDVEMIVDMWVDSEEEAAATLADMALLTKHIVATHHVVELGVDLSNQYSVHEVAATLGPLVPRIKALRFNKFTFVPTEWRELEALLRSVRALQFYECQLTSEMLALFAESADLQDLCFVRCPFAAIEETFVEMAAVRSAPLTLSMGAQVLSPHIIAQCRAAAERAHGAQYITFT